MRKILLSCNIWIYGVLFALWCIFGVKYSVAGIVICAVSVLLSCIIFGVTRKDRTAFEKLRSIESMLFAVLMILLAVCSKYMSAIPEPYGIILYSLLNGCVISIFVDRIFKVTK